MRVGSHGFVYRPLFHLTKCRQLDIRVSFRHPLCRQLSATAGKHAQNDVNNTRNLGIIAHIDAGKTTTTERMLYYSGYTRRIGDVDDGSTVTDFLPAERARGITIQSAAISFLWPPKDSITKAVGEQCNINLIDTPGHADFTFEVMRSLRVLDGAICILDGVAGVEAQTEKVWLQADQHGIPRLVYINKLDREGAAFRRTVKEIGARLHAMPAVCAIPWWRAGDRKLCGTGDVVHLKGYLWQENSDGKTFESLSLENLEKDDAELANELKRARIALIELLSEHDDGIVEEFFNAEEDHLSVTPAAILKSLRRCVLALPQSIFPVFAGASFRNLGVQPLLDAAAVLLPSPSDRPDPAIALGDTRTTLGRLLGGDVKVERPAPQKGGSKKGTPPLQIVARNLTSCSLAFKVVNDAKRGVLVYVRVYSGRLARGSLLYNTNLGVVEKVPKLLKMYASDAVEVDSIAAGQIGVITGSKHARTGDTLIAYTNMNPRHGPPVPINSLQLQPIEVPPPVFWTSVEPNSLSEEKHIDEILAILLREDPSLNVTVDPESGQKHLAGMGELHLEIACDRLIQDFRAKAHVGKIEISYRESIQVSTEPEICEMERDHTGKTAHAACVVSVSPASLISKGDESSDADQSAVIVSLSDNNHLTILHPGLDRLGKPIPNSTTPELPSDLSYLQLVSGVRNGVTAAFARGPAYGFSIHSTHVTITIDPATQIFSDTTASAVALVVRQGVQKAMRAISQQDGSSLMEPVMHATINVSETDMGSVIHDLSSARGAQIISLDEFDGASAASGQANAGSSVRDIDVKRIYAPLDPFETDESSNEINIGAQRQRQIAARVPLREMIGYLKHLRSLTGGRGTFVMQVDQFEKVTGNRLKTILKELRGIR